MAPFVVAWWAVQMMLWGALFLAVIAIFLTARALLSSEAWEGRKRSDKSPQQDRRQVETEAQHAFSHVGTTKKVA
jgi:hypothetical protein